MPSFETPKDLPAPVSATPNTSENNSSSSVKEEPKVIPKMTKPDPPNQTKRPRTPENGVNNTSFR